MERKVLFLVAGGLLVAAALFWGWRWLLAEPPRPSVEELAHAALTAKTPQEREQVAVELAQRGGQPAVQQMVQVFTQSDVPQVRAAMIQGLAVERDFDRMPVFLDALDDPSLLVRTRALGAVRRLLQIDVPSYRPEAEHKDRLPGIAIYRKDWENVQKTPGLRRFREKLRQEGS